MSKKMQRYYVLWGVFCITVGSFGLGMVTISGSDGYPAPYIVVIASVVSLFYGLGCALAAVL